ncbi:hypothetical protein [Crateriforma conspicua]|uniref:hypothetical protein n=1 Tax=Crateriforma conspicua TaxID=2527996 RepID=UPI00118B4F01|nr:hypothetical protein [Crateriforma conspicua]QDV64940.1 hypothetical protein Mal65_41080 [Crateriforma conspicua]
MLRRRKSVQTACLYAWLALTFVVITGCSRKVYLVDLRPDGDVIHRDITIVHEIDSKRQPLKDIGESELRRLHEAYPDSPLKYTDDGYRFSGDFASAMPQDIGGHGNYQHLATSLGDHFAYLERFRGSVDVADNLQQRYEAFDTWADLIGGWLEQQIDDAECRDKVMHWFNGDFRNDARSLILSLWTAEATNQIVPQTDPTWLATMAIQFLLERDYIRPSDAPRLARLAWPTTAEHASDQLVRCMQRKLELTPQQTKALQFASDPKAMHRSLESYVRETDAYRDSVTQWRHDHPDAADDQQPTPMGFVTERLLAAASPHLFGPGSEVAEVHLLLDAPPHWTNGTWQADEGHVFWSLGISGSPLPPMAMAAWSVADVSQQTRVLGDVVLRERELSQYVLWYHGLSQSEQTQWDDLLESLSDSDDRDADLARFHFSDESIDDKHRDSKIGVDLIRQSLP